MPTRQVLCKRANYLQSSRTHTTPHIYYICMYSCVYMYMKVKAIFDKHQLFSPRRSLWKFPTAESCTLFKRYEGGGSVRAGTLVLLACYRNILGVERAYKRMRRAPQTGMQSTPEKKRILSTFNDFCFLLFSLCMSSVAYYFIA